MTDWPSVKGVVARLERRRRRPGTAVETVVRGDISPIYPPIGAPQTADQPPRGRGPRLFMVTMAGGKRFAVRGSDEADVHRTLLGTITAPGFVNDIDDVVLVSEITSMSRGRSRV